MRVSRVLATTGALTLLGVGLAAPASADHAAEISLDGKSCFLGAWGSPVPLHLSTSDKKRIKFKVYKDRSAKWTCTFKVPKYLAADDPRNVWEQEWYLPKKTVIQKSVECWRPGEEATDNNTAKGSRIILRPNGKLTLTCHTDGNYYTYPPH